MLMSVESPRGTPMASHIETTRYSLQKLDIADNLVSNKASTVRSRVPVKRMFYKLNADFLAKIVVYITEVIRFYLCKVSMRSAFTNNHGSKSKTSLGR